MRSDDPVTVVEVRCLATAPGREYEEADADLIVRAPVFPLHQQCWPRSKKKAK